MLMQDAISLANFERMEKGLPPIVEKIKREEPKPPRIDNPLLYSDIQNSAEKLISAERKIVKNEDGINFIYYSVAVSVKDKDKTKIVSGLMTENDYDKLLVILRDKVGVLRRTPL